MPERIYHIYRYTNILNGMKYHGKTCLKYQGTRAGKEGRNYYKCPKFGEAIKEYGWSNFKYEVLEDGLTKEEAEIREQYWIEKENSIWPNGYNMALGGAGTPGIHPWNKGQGTEVLQFTKDGQFLHKYSTPKEASLETGVCYHNILRCCKGQRETAGESIWKYA